MFLVPQIPETCGSITCGANAFCSQKPGVLACTCKPGYSGNPLLACHPECIVNNDCPFDKACIGNKCENPCANVCGIHANCEIINHVPLCYCPPEYSGDPFVACNPYYLPPVSHIPLNPCDPSPCGPNSRCLINHEKYATCSCLPGYDGLPPYCKPECLLSSDCLQTQACVNQQCVDPCPGTCGIGARCAIINHNPICSCAPGQIGDPFVSCQTPSVVEQPKNPENPCEPSPCGPNSICQVKQNRPVCSCLANYIGSPPYCRPECSISQECPRDKACIKEKCQNPCNGNCGVNAKCDVVNHSPFCSCLNGYEGDAFIGCSRIPEIIVPSDPCIPSPCGENTQCTNRNGVAVCTCIPPYIGQPYGGGCRPECIGNGECPNHLACISQHCRDPCPGVCGSNAECSVVNHVPVCACLPGYSGDPFRSCRYEPVTVRPTNPCEPTPCGANSICRVVSGHSVCSCQGGYVGAPPNCRPECVLNNDCSADKTCIQNKCRDPCPGTCGVNARCQVISHLPHCICPTGYEGDPFVNCIPESPRVPDIPANPCLPSPCGANSECRVSDSRPVCSCLPGMFGAPPNCRPECAIHQDCPATLACVNNKCRDPCAGACGFNTECSVQNHRPVCRCIQGFEGDPFSSCNPIQSKFFFLLIILRLKLFLC